MSVVFYKGVLVNELNNNYIPGSVTTCVKEALMWKERINSKKYKGAAKHVTHGKSCIIKLQVDTTDFLSASEFQRTGVAEHSRLNCWMNAVKTKAQNKSVKPVKEILQDRLTASTPNTKLRLFV